MPNENEEEIARFFDQERGKLSGYIRKKLYRASGMETDDIVQDIMLRVLSAASDNPIGNIGAYIYRAARNWITDYFRKKDRQSLIDSREDPDEIIGNALDGKADIEAILADREYRKVLYDALDKLNPDQKAVWESVELDGYTFQELSEKWQVPLGTLLARKARAEENLRRIIRPELL